MKDEVVVRLSRDDARALRDAARQMMGNALVRRMATAEQRVLHARWMRALDVALSSNGAGLVLVDGKDEDQG